MNQKNEIWAFPGLHYFEDNPVDQQLFFGRDREIKELTEKIIAEDITVLFGKSGDGKTSLINAGLKPAFRELGYLPVRARIFNPPENSSPIKFLYQTVEAEANENKLELPKGWQKETLWESFFNLRPTEGNQLKPILLILDQFEELFTLLAARKSDQEDFIQQFADLVRGRLPQEVRDRYRAKLQTLEAGSTEALQLEKLLFDTTSPGVKIVISMREDYLAYLDNLGQRIPKVYDSRYRLPALSIKQAREAITNPPQQKVLGKNSFQIKEDAIIAIIQFLTTQSSRSGIREEVVGPPQLQVICRQLENQMRQQGKDIIEIEDLGSKKGMHQLLSRYYRGITKNIPQIRVGPGPRKLSGLLGVIRRFQPVHLPRLAVHFLCEDRLITAGGNRNSRHEEEIIHEIGVAKPDLELLVNNRLLRREPKLTEAFYELSHDSLVPSLQTAGGWRQRLAMGLKIIIFASFIFMVLSQGIPYMRNLLEIDRLNRELAAMKKGNISIETFKVLLYRAKTTINDTVELGKYQNELKKYFLTLDSPNLQKADSVLQALTWVYPQEIELIAELSDTLHERRYRDVEKRYFQMVSHQDSTKIPISFEITQSFLDSVEAELKDENRIINLQADLAKRRGDKATADQLIKEAERQQELSRRQLRDAIRIKEPSSDTLIISATETLSQLEIVLYNHHLLKNAIIIINGQRMSPKTIGKKKFMAGKVLIPPKANKVNVQIIALDTKNNKSVRNFNYTIERIPFRIEPNKYLTSEEVKKMLIENDFYDRNWNKNGKGIKNHFELLYQGDVVLDRATGLMWQQSSSILSYNEAENYIHKLNIDQFSGFSDWRLPTLEEAMSLVEPIKNSNFLFIDPIFDFEQSYIWTSDLVKGESWAWVVSFYHGYCSYYRFNWISGHVRGVRFRQSSER